MRKANMNDIVFSGCPPPALPADRGVRRDSMGRRISPTALEALKATQFKPGQSGNPGGNFKRQREHTLAVVIRLMMSGKLQPSDSIADLLNLLNEMDSASLRSESGRFLRALRKLNEIPL